MHNCEVPSLVLLFKLQNYHVFSRTFVNELMAAQAKRNLKTLKDSTGKPLFCDMALTVIDSQFYYRLHLR